jgi:adenylate cyclase
MSGCTEVEGVTRTALEALDDLFGFQHAILLLADEGSRELFAVAGHGYNTSTAGAEVTFGEGVIGTAAESQRVICLSNVARSRVMRDAVHARRSETADLRRRRLRDQGRAGADPVEDAPGVRV